MESLSHTGKVKILFNSWDIAEACAGPDKTTIFFRKLYEAIEWTLVSDWQ